MRVPSSQFKVQFARMGEPALNPAVNRVLEFLPERMDAPGFMPSVSTVAPEGADDFFAELLEVKDRLYRNGSFQLQFSIHTTDPVMRREIVPVKTWSMERIADYGNSFFSEGDRKITLNFALAKGSPLDPQVLLDHFDPRVFLVKITPVNPTYRAAENGLSSHIDPSGQNGGDRLADFVREAGYQVIVSIGEQEENRIGSNCGQYLRAHLDSGDSLPGGYTYAVSGGTG